MIRESQSFEDRVLRADVVENPSIIQDIPAEFWSKRSRHASRRVEQLAKLLGRQPDGSVERQAGVEIGRGDANPRALGRDQALGLPDVGAATKQIGRDAYRHFIRRLGSVSCLRQYGS